MKVRVKGEYIMFHCVSCSHAHVVPFRGANAWSWNGDSDKPTLTPSLRVNDGYGTCCHLNVTEGKLQYHGDHPGPLRGQTVPMVDWSEPVGTR